MKALAITLAVGAALWAGSVPLQPKLAAAASDLAPRAKARAGVCRRHRCWWRSDDLSPAGLLRLWTGLSSYGPAGSVMDLPGTRTATAQASTAGSGERSSSRRNRKPPFRRGRLRSAQ